MQGGLGRNTTQCEVEIDLLLDVLGESKTLKNKLIAIIRNRSRKKLKELDDREDGTDDPDQ